jgi:hypothetical protein
MLIDARIRLPTEIFNHSAFKLEDFMPARTYIRLGALVAATLGAVGAVATPASASITYTGILSNGSYIGELNWNRDAWNSIPGDAMRICDTAADGIGVEGRLIVNGAVNRAATTAGNNSPYCSPWKSGDLPEGRQYTVKVYKVKAGVYTFLGDYPVWS